MVKTRTLGNK